MTTTSRIVYVNGEYVPEAEAKVSIFDRAFLMGDSVYEGTSVLGGKLLDFDGHIARLERSMSELNMTSPATRDELLDINRELIARNEVVDGLVYLQVTRGVAERDFVIPKDAKPGLVLFTQSKPGLANSVESQTGLKIVSVPDLRWGRRDIKTTQLLHQSMGKTQAYAAGAHDAWMVQDGKVTEGTSNNAYIIKDNTIVTRQLGTEILPGITRAAVLRFAQEAQMRVEERAFTIEEAQAADEAFVTSATTFVMPVVEIDGVELGAGVPGEATKRLREIYIEESKKTAI